MHHKSYGSKLNQIILTIQVEAFLVNSLINSRTLHITPFCYFYNTLYNVQYIENYIRYRIYIFYLANMYTKIYGRHLNQIILSFQVEAFFGKFLGRFSCFLYNTFLLFFITPCIFIKFMKITFST